MKKIFISILLSYSILSAQSAGSSGLSFLKFGFGARNVAMGDFGSSARNGDLNSFHYNPALIAVNAGTQISFSHNNLMTDLSSEMFAASFFLFGTPVAVGLNATSVNGIEVRTKPGEPESKFDANFFFGSISVARELSAGLFAGATVKYIYENLYSDDAAGFGFDFGLSYFGLLDNFSINTSVRNIGSMNRLRNQATQLPGDFRVGLQYNYLVEAIKLNLSAIAGWQKYIDAGDSHLHFGLEALYNKFLALRAGYVTGYESKSISAGFGIVWNNFNFDYAYVPYEFGLGNTSVLTFTYNFD